MSKSSLNVSTSGCIQIKKRDGRMQDISFDKILYRIGALSKDLHVETTRLTQDVIGQLYNGISSSKIDELSANEAHHRVTIHPDYDTLAARIAISNHHKETIDEFSIVMLDLYENGQLSDSFHQIVQRCAKEFDSMISYNKDGLLSYHGFNTFIRSYGLRINGKVVERPQHMWMRVAVGIWGDNLERVKETYEWMSTKHFIHASPTLFNCGNKVQQLSSCFLIAMKTEDIHPGDSISKIFETVSDCAKISKTSGGIGLHISNIRASGSPIRTAGNDSNGIVPMLKVFEATARYVDQGRKRKGAIANYLEPWHADVFDFIQLRKNTGSEELRARDLHLALWIPDLFMKRVMANEKWSLMSPFESPGLFEVYGQQFEDLYTRYEREGKYVRQVDAQELFVAIISAQMETGEPYVLYKDHVNHKNNQANLGTIRSSNLCAEIVEYSDNKRTAVCNLSSIALGSFVKGGKQVRRNNFLDTNEDEVRSRTTSFESEEGDNGEDGEKPWFDFKELEFVTRIVTRNLNRIIDINFYPTPETEFSNKSERPMGIGVQGLADCFNMMRYGFDSEEAAKLNREMFECIYYSAVSESCKLAQLEGPYDTFKGSPISQGKFQFDLWKEQGYPVQFSGKWDWEALRRDVVKYGVRNSLLVALMPTASSSQLLGYNECFEPFTSNMYTRRTLAGSYKIVNKQLIFDLIEEGLWSTDMKDKILYYDGSVQPIDEIPDHIKSLYKTSWDLSQKVIVDLAADRAPFIDQTQSMNIHIGVPSVEKLSSLHFYTWKRGLKTGMYYLRTNPSHRAVQITIDPRIGQKKVDNTTLKTMSTPYSQQPPQPQVLPKDQPYPQEHPPNHNKIDFSKYTTTQILDMLPSLNEDKSSEESKWKPVSQEECVSCGS